jgi:PAS domain S-box-containing protein
MSTSTWLFPSARRGASTLSAYCLSVSSVAAALAFVLWLHVPPLFLPAVVASAWWGGRKPGLLAAVLSISGTSLYLNPAGFGLGISDFGDAVYLVLWSSSALLTAWLVARQRETAEALTLFRALIDHTNDAIEVVDPESGRILEVNQRACIAHGYTREEYRALRVGDMDPQAAGRSWGEVREEMRRVGTRMFEGRRRRKDGSVFPVEATATSIRLDRDYLLVVVRDISERVQAEAALRLRDRAMQAVSQGITITDASHPDNPIVYVSPGFERITGYSGEEVLGKNPRLLQGPESDLAATAQLRESIRAGRQFGVEILNYRKDGSPFWNAIVMAPLLEGGRLTHWVSVSTDITERRQLEEKLRQAQKMEAVGRLAGGVAHDFNNMLTVINGNSELVLAHLDSDDPNRELISEIREAGERAADLTRQLLAFSRKQAVRVEVVSINTRLRELLNLLSRLIGADVEIVFAPDPSLGVVRMDPGLFDQAIINLAVNARDAMPRGGRLTIETRGVELDAEYADRHPSVPPSRYALVRVGDTGQGMDAGTRARVFEPFFTTKKTGEGTGLGLSMVYGFVKQSGGHIELHSELGRGTTFLLYLPLAGETHPAEAPPARSPRTAGGAETVLLVEDDENVRTLSRLALQSWGYTVLEARNGQEAISVAGHYAGTIHLLVTDVVMPGMNGRRLAELLVGARPRLRVLLMSGHSEETVLRHGALEAGSAFLEKPFSPIDLARRAREVLDAESDPE